ncbi:MAG: FtsX-like permease family protein [Chitinophagales bacterium]
MIKFLLKGILRDKSRSILPIIIVSIGVALTVLLSGYMRGAMGDVTDQNARFDTGHVKVMTKAYAENIDQLPNDLALLEVTSLIESLQNDFPQMYWVKRTRFGGLIDVPDENGNSKGQGPASGLAINLLGKESGEAKRMNIESSIVTGNLPDERGEALIGHDFAQKLGLKIGDEFTYFGTTMNGSMSFQNFKISGTIRYGMAAMDRGALVIDIADAQKMLDMEDGTGEVLGFLKSKVYDDKQAIEVADAFNAKYVNDPDEFAPVMQTLKQQNNLADLLDYADVMSGLFVFMFVAAMSVVLWNTGLLAGLRRYKEFGIRLALGESKGAIYRALILEAVLIGVIGSIIGTVVGLGFTYYLQVYGIDISSYVENSSMLMPSVIRAKITPELFYIGFVPGLAAMVLGNMLSGMGIYKRETASLFKELEV